MAGLLAAEKINKKPRNRNFEKCVALVFDLVPIK
jgi:hypothetical protein